MFLGVFGVEVERACSDSAPSADLVPSPPEVERPYSQCFRKHTLRAVEYTKGFAYEAMSWKGLDVMADGFVEGQPYGGWHYGSDVLWKKPPGWLAGDNDGKALNMSNMISFAAQTSNKGWIRLEYLATYGPMGNATCWLEGMDSDEGCVINSLAYTHYSERQAYFMQVTGGSAKTLHCHASGGKFKILAFASC